MEVGPKLPALSGLRREPHKEEENVDRIHSGARLAAWLSQLLVPRGAQGLGMAGIQTESLSFWAKARGELRVACCCGSGKSAGRRGVRQQVSTALGLRKGRWHQGHQ